MSTIEEFTVLFKDRAAELPPITGKLTDDNLKTPQEVLENLLQAVKLLGRTNAKGLITTEANYQATHAGATFENLNMPLKAYNPSIDSNSTTTDRIRAERKWTAGIFCQCLLRSAKRGAHTLILRGV